MNSKFLFLAFIMLSWFSVSFTMETPEFIQVINSGKSDTSYDKENKFNLYEKDLIMEDKPTFMDMAVKRNNICVVQLSSRDVNGNVVINYYEAGNFIKAMGIVSSLVEAEDIAINPESIEHFKSIFQTIKDNLIIYDPINDQEIFAIKSFIVGSQDGRARIIQSINFLKILTRKEKQNLFKTTLLGLVCPQSGAALGLALICIFLGNALLYVYGLNLEHPCLIDQFDEMAL